MIGMVLAVVALQAGQAERYGMVVTRGGDTVSVERVTRDRNTARSEVFVPDRARLEVVAGTDRHGCVSGVEVRVYPWLSVPGGTPL